MSNTPSLARRLIMSPCWVMPSSVLKSSVRSSSVKTRKFSSTHSSRGKRAVTLLPDYLADARAVVRYSPSTPDGALQLGVAENQMLEDLLVPALTEFGSKAFAADCIYYQPTHGRPALREAFCDYLQRLLKLGDRKLDPDGLIMGTGCNAVLENLCITLAEPGEGVLIPTPYYAAFEFDLVARAGLSIIPVNTFQHSGATIPPADDEDNQSIPVEAYFPTRASLTAALNRATLEGESPRILLLSHPNNPLGISYPPSVVKECIAWCRENKIHLVSDEIYAGSLHKDSHNFESALALAGDDLGPYIHFVYALSKDFALSGLRVGACYSENEDIRLPLQKLNDMCQISSQTQVLVENMVKAKSNDGEFWTSEFLAENNSRIRARSTALQAILNEFNIPHLNPTSGLFCWMDMSKYLPPLEDAMITPEGDEVLESMQTRERALYLELMNEHGLLFTPGLSMRNERAGFFRCVFTAASDEEFDLALMRLRKFAQAKQA